MSTIFTHPAIPLALGLGLNMGMRPFLKTRGSMLSSVVPFRLLLLGCLFSILPDLDVIGFELGVSYWSGYGHRGFTHSIFLQWLVGWWQCTGLHGLVHPEKSFSVSSALAWRPTVCSTP